MENKLFSELTKNLNHLSFSYSYAGQVSVGDEILVQKDDNILPAKVINVSSIIMQGDLISFNIYIFLVDPLSLYCNKITQFQM